MAKQSINRGTTANDGTGDSLRDAAGKINDNFDELYEFKDTGIAEIIRDTMGTALVAGTNVTITPNDAGNTITIAATGGGGGLDAESVRDTIAAALVAGAGVTLTVNDAGDTITVATSVAGISFTTGQVGAIARNLQDKLRKDLPVTPYDFTAAGHTPAAPYISIDNRTTSGIPDDGAALALFFAAHALLANTNVKFDCTGFFGTSIGLTVGPVTCGYAARPSMRGDLVLVNLNSGLTTPLLTLRNLNGGTWHGSIELVAGGSAQSYASKHRRALHLDGKMTGFVVTGGVQFFGFVYGLTAVTESVGEFMEWVTIPYLSAMDCGSGPVTSHSTAGLTSTFSSITQSGNSWEQGQRTILNGLSVDLPSWVDAIGNFTQQCVAVSINGRPYWVESVNRSTHTVTIYPKLANSVGTSGTLTWMFGGALVEGGADGSLLNIGVLATTRCIGRSSMAIYPSSVSYHTSQFDSCRVIMGYPEYRQQGGYEGGCYVEGEGASTYDLVIFNSGVNGYRFGTPEMMDSAKVFAPYAWDGAQDVAGPSLYGTLWGNSKFEKKRSSINAGFGGDFLYINASVSPVATYDPVNNLTLDLPAYDRGEFDRWGVCSRIVVVTGTGSNKQPTGSIIINAASIVAGKTINGSSTITFTSLKAPLMLLITADPATGNFTANHLNKPFVTQAAITTPTADVTSLKTAVDTIRAALTATGITA
jgi:hypothetical protein